MPRLLPAPDDPSRLLPILLIQATGLVCGLIGVHVTSRWVSPGDFGLYGIFISLVPLGSGVLYTGIVKYVSRHWLLASDRPALRRTVLQATVRKLPWLVLAVVLAALVSPRTGSVTFGVALFASALLSTLTQYVQAALQAERLHWRDLGVSSCLSVSRALIPPLFYVASAAGVAALLSGFVLHALIGATAAASAIRGRWKSLVADPKTPAPLSVYEGSLFILLAIAGWALVGANRWMVAWFFGTESAGYFTLASNIATILPSMFGTVLLQYLQPDWFAGRYEIQASRANLLRAADRAALSYTAGAVAMTFALNAALPWLIGPVISVRYASAAAFVLGAGCFATAVTVGLFYHVMLLALHRERGCGPADLCSAGCLIAGSLASAWVGPQWFTRWLALSPLVPLLVQRPLARRAALKAA